MSTAERIEILPEYQALFASLHSLVSPRLDATRDRGLTIGIAGESGSGKSVTATGLARVLEESGVRTCVLHQDDYFLLPPRANHEHRCVDLAHVGPHEVNLAMMQSHIAAFRARRRDVVVPRVDYASDSFGTRNVDFSGVGALIVEGTYVLTLEELDVGIFLDATHVDTGERRRARNRDIDAPIIDRVLAIEHRIIAPQASRAQIVIDRDFRIRDGRR